MAVGLALRTGKNTSAQGEEANQAVEVASLGVVKQVNGSVSLVVHTIQQTHAMNSYTRIVGGSKKGSQVSYVRQVPKFLQAHAHLLGKGAAASLAGPEGATLVQDVDSDKEDDLEHDDGVRQISCMPEEAEMCRHQYTFLPW